MLRVVAGNAQHIGSRQEQQDSFAFSNQGDTAFSAHGGLLGVVADGMGGLEGGHQASSSAVDAFLAGYKRKAPSDSIPAALYRSLEEANRTVLAVARRIGAEGNTGTTLAAAVVHNDQLYWISAGDSRIYLLRDGQLVRVNEDHTYTVSLWPSVAAGTLEREDALNDPQGQHLTSHLGMEQVALVDIAQRPFALQPDDTVVVCSDGIYRAVGDGEMVEAFRRSVPARACEAIKAAVLAKGRSRQDNLTIIAIQCQQAGVPAQPMPISVRKKRTNPLLVAAIVVELAAITCLGALYALKLRRQSEAQHAPAAQHTPATPAHPLKTTPLPAPSNGEHSHAQQKPPAAKPSSPSATETKPDSSNTPGSGSGAATPQQSAPAVPPQPGVAAPSAVSPQPGTAASHATQGQKPSHSTQHKTTPESQGGPQ